jgi:caffeoyl-CoA O-methyltransferase
MPGKTLEPSDALYAYILAHRSHANDPVLEELRTETLALGAISRMSIVPEQASLLRLLVGAIGAKWAVEVGTFTGASSISIARGLAPGGRLACFDLASEWTAVAQRYWVKAGVADRIELRLGDARELLPAFQPHAPLDFVFIDADKPSYDFYYETLLPLVRPGGLILLDNMLRGGAVLEPEAKQTADARAIDLLNRKLAADSRIEGMLLPFADGIYLCRKLPEQAAP